MHLGIDVEVLLVTKPFNGPTLAIGHAATFGRLMTHDRFLTRRILANVKFVINGGPHDPKELFDLCVQSSDVRIE